MGLGKQPMGMESGLAASLQERLVRTRGDQERGSCPAPRPPTRTPRVPTFLHIHL